jgi:hypothetical protein
MKFFDRVKETSTTTGTGAFTVAGAESGFVTFSSVLTVTDTFYYCIQSKTPDEWEVGIGTYSAANTLTRTTPIVGSAATPVDFSAGDKDVFITVAADLFTNLLALGETSATAYRGDRGKTAYDHSQAAHAPSDAEANVNADWDASSGDAQILNKPTIPTLPVKASGAEIIEGTDDAKFATAKALVDAGNVLAATVQTLTNKSIYLPDGEGLNYLISPSIASSNLTVALKTFAGTDPSATDISIFSIGAAMLSVASALSVDVTAALGDIFAWDAGKIQANDAQLFVYLINNNGTPQIGVSPCPTHLTVATNYYSNGSQTGAAGHTNMVMSGTRNATNSCRVIGRINVNQLDNNNWQAPTTTLVVNKAIDKTDWLTWTPTYTGFSTPPTSFMTLYKLDRETVSLITREYPAGTSNSTSFTKTAPILSKTIANMAWVGWLFTAYDAGAVFSPPGEVAIDSNSQSLYLSKVPGNAASWTNSAGKRAQIMNFIYQVS